MLMLDKLAMLEKMEFCWNFQQGAGGLASICFSEGAYIMQELGFNVLLPCYS